MNIVAISDTHHKHKQLIIPPCDLLIHSGDWTGRGEKHGVEDLAKWLQVQPAKDVVIIPGNHELHFEENWPASKAWVLDHCPRAHVLVDESVIVQDVKIHGSPATPFFCDWAWNRNPGPDDKLMQVSYMKEKLIKSIKPHWDMIPSDTNILITHGPPYGILDQTTYANRDIRPEHLGCKLLMERVLEVKPDLHFFGHIHHPGGTQVHKDGTSFYNAACCDEHYCITNPLTIVEYEK